MNDTTTQTHAFQAEVSEMLHLVVHSLYSKKEIFLRELISNASDAIDRAQYLGLTDKELVADSPEWSIEILLNKEKRLLQISDNGLGMSAEEATNNLGTIARSGTRAFIEALKKDGAAATPEMIGQFGVGFYAAFMVAEEVTVDSLRRGSGAQAIRWHSSGQGSFTLGPSERTTPGTTITLKLQEEQVSFLEEWQVRDLVKRYSDFIAYPIRLAVDGKEIDPQSAPLNTMRALWKRDRNSIKEEEYQEFYKHLTHDFNNPLRTIHYNVEGQLEFRALLFLPEKPPFDLYFPGRKHGLQLYVRNVFIGADFEALLPEYLRFVKGVVDSSDLPLNVSREMLQDDAIIVKIRKNLVNRILSDLEKLMAENSEGYNNFYRGFGRVLKEGLYSDHEHADKLKELLLFASDQSAEGKLTSLRDYRAAMPTTQQEIYYLTATDLATAKQVPQLEAFRKRQLDVLFFTDRIDAWIIDGLGEYDGCKLRSITQGELELGDESEQAAAKAERAADAEQFRPLLDWLKARLSDDLKEVRLSSRLTDSASCMVADEEALNPAMLQMMAEMGQEVPKVKRTLELNARHPLLASLLSRFEAERDSDAFAADAELLYDLALVAEGTAPRQPQRFAQAIATLLATTPVVE